VGLGVLATVYYFSWWGEGGRIASPLLAVLLVAAALYHWGQLLSSWVIYLAARRNCWQPPSDRAAGLSVDVFVTACGESVELVERAVRAALAMRGDHRTWLLDDGDDSRLHRLAERLGAGYLTRNGRSGAKAGNLNVALSRTEGDVVVIFDIDHAPTPDFLQRTLGCFSDPEVGFVQVALTFANSEQSWFARAASESCVDFFNPSSIGMDGLGSATLIGTNALIRRAALESIGGYQQGLAEDLATSIAIHGSGWKSVYVPEPLAPGLAPADPGAWFTQQFKWARGVFEVLLTSYFRLWPRLRWGQRLAYGVRATYYWVGSVTLVHMGFTAAVLLGGERVARVDLQQYLLHLLPLTLVAFGIRLAALWCWRYPGVRVGPQWRAVVLVHGSWPIYALAWLMALARLPLRFRATPKTSTGRMGWTWLLQQALIAALLLVAAAIGRDGPFPILAGFAVVQALPTLVLLRQTARLGQERRKRDWPRSARLGEVSPSGN
jgi:cellulose synthase (UDP-forming)